MKLISVKCPECGAGLNVEEDRKQVFCMYCGTKILLHNENEHIYRHVDEARIKETETERLIRLKQMEIDEKKLGIDSERVVDVLNIKCDPLLIGSLRMKEGFYPAYHMNKDKWVSVIMDGTIPTDEIKALIKLSYNLTEK